MSHPTTTGPAPGSQPGTGPPAEADAPTEAARLALLIQALAVGVLVESEQRRVVLTNQAYCEMFAIPGPPEAVIGADCADVVAVSAGMMADPAGFLARASALLGATVPARDEVRFADGRVSERDYIPVFVGDGYRGSLWVYRDVTNRGAAEETRRAIEHAHDAARAAEVQSHRERAREAELAHRMLAEQHESLRAIDELRRQLLATASHELRTPLTSIVSFLGLLRDGDPMTGQQYEFLDVISRNAERLLTMVNNMLLLARFGSGAEDLDLEDIDFPGLVSEAASDAAPAAAAKGVSLRTHVRPGPPVVADRARITQVVTNLVGNAVKFTPSGGEVTVTAHPHGTGWQLTVTDTGIGIPAAEAGQVFGQFFRASTARLAGVPGTGLGLAICKAIVEQHHGTISIHSSDGRGGRPAGTVVTVLLPELT